MAINLRVFGNEDRHVLSAFLNGQLVHEQVRGGHNVDWIVRQFRRSCRQENLAYDLIMVDGEEYKPGKR